MKLSPVLDALCTRNHRRPWYASAMLDVPVYAQPNGSCAARPPVKCTLILAVATLAAVVAPQVGAAQSHAQTRSHTKTRGHAQAIAVKSRSAGLHPAPSATDETKNSTGASDSRYRQWVDQAVTEYRLEHFEEAQALFEKAHEENPSARTLRGLAATAYGLRDYVECIARMEAALASPVQPLRGQLRAGSIQLLHKARTFVGRVTLRITPAHSEVTIDNEPIARADHDHTLLLNLGGHVLEASAPNYQTRTRRFEIRGAGQQLLELNLPRLSVATPAAQFDTTVAAPFALSATGSAHLTQPGQPIQERPDGEGDAWYQSPWLWTSVGVAGVAITITLVVVLTRGAPAVNGGTTRTVLTAF